VVGVVSYRIAQYWLPILVGGGTYLSLRVGPWAISKDRLEPLRDVVAHVGESEESILDFSERYPARERTREIPKPIDPYVADPTRELPDKPIDGEPPTDQQ